MKKIVSALPSRTHILVIFFVFQCFFYAFMYFARTIVPFHTQHYRDYHNKYFQTTQRDSVPEDFIHNLVVYDAQWYLQLGSNGYATPSQKELKTPAESPAVLSYVYFPLYPLILAIGNTVFGNVELTAFLFSLLLQLGNATLLYTLVKKVMTSETAAKTVILIFTFPFGIFFRSYYTENLFLFLLLTFSYLLMTKRYSIAAIPLGLLLVTRGAGMLLLPLYGYILLRTVRTTQRQIPHALAALCVACIPLLGWIAFCWYQTGDPFIFFTIKQYWLYTKFPLLRILYSFSVFPWLPFHDFHASKIDIIMIMSTGILLFKSKKILPSVLWWIALCLWITPLLTHDTMSYSRYQIVNYPLFLYLADQVKGKNYWIFVILCALSLLCVSVLFLNFYWIG